MSARAEALSYSAVKLFSKNSNLCAHGTWSLQTDGRLTVASPRSALASHGKNYSPSSISMGWISKCVKAIHNAPMGQQSVNKGKNQERCQKLQSLKKTAKKFRRKLQISDPCQLQGLSIIMTQKRIPVITAFLQLLVSYHDSLPLTCSYSPFMSYAPVQLVHFYRQFLSLPASRTQMMDELHAAQSIA